MASGPIISWQRAGGKKWKLIFSSPKATAEFSNPWKSYDKPRQHTENQRHFFADKGPSSQSYGFSSSYIWMSWTIKKAEPWKIDAFELWCWRRLLRVSWIAKRPNQSILKEISPEYSLEGLMLKLKLQYFGHLMQRNNSLEKTVMLGKIEGKRSC